MKRLYALALLCSVPIVASCGAGVVGDTEVVARWSLVAGDDLALTDPVRPGMSYPNLDEFESMDLVLTRDGALCGTFVKGRVSSRACGGPGVGIPYFVLPANTEGMLNLGVIDLYGNHVLDSEVLRDTCIQRRDGCMLCSDVNGAVTEDTCVAYTSDSDPANPSEPANPMDGEPATTPATPCFVQGAEAFAGFVNAQLTFMSLPQWQLDAASLEVPSVDSINGELGFWLQVYGADGNGGLCADFAGHDLKQMGEVTEDTYMFGPRLRCGHLANDALVSGCQGVAETCSGPDLVAFEGGLLAAHQAWTATEGGPWAWDAQSADEDCDNPEHPCDEPTEGPPECAGSPLVFSLDAAPVELMSIDEGPRFDLMSTGKQTQTGWVRHGSMLALDLDGNGRIDGGHELFGEATKLWSGGLANDGFHALGQYDDALMGGTPDGTIDAHDAIYSQLQVWTDANHDGVASQEELTSIVDAGVRAVSVGSQRHTPTSAMPAAGNEIGLESTIELKDGSTIPVYDVWFTYRIMRMGS